ncbi:hypothetical protein [Paenibacillus piri]|uniref:hypothetical protein n=1 Tax=Paenibacillus piri TaxID=2547395 RepID=UPI00140553A4|nr:hypothetical protein [Paenibacillus piri]
MGTGREDSGSQENDNNEMMDLNRFERQLRVVPSTNRHSGNVQAAKDCLFMTMEE